MVIDRMSDKPASPPTTNVTNTHIRKIISKIILNPEYIKTVEKSIGKLDMVRHHDSATISYHTENKKRKPTSITLADFLFFNSYILKLS